MDFTWKDLELWDSLVFEACLNSKDPGRKEAFDEWQAMLTDIGEAGA